jgi:adenylate cyclase
VGDPAKAIPYLERAMRLDPAYRHQHIHFLGVAQFVAGNYEAAVQLFRERISMHPTTDLSRAFLGSALGHLNRLDEARQIWDELKDINPDYSHVRHIGRLPFKYQADAAKFIDGLRKAGVAE